MALIKKIIVEKLPVEIYDSTAKMGLAAAEQAADIIREAVLKRGIANIILATGNSQLAFLQALRSLPDIPWAAVNAFHMDDYVHLAAGHPAGFPLTLRRNLFDHIQIGNFFPVPGWAADLETACQGYEMLLRAHPADLCCLGIGENGHLAFNEPGDADFDDPQWVKVISLSEASRRQQVGEGHFSTLENTPTQAITLTIPALLSANHVLAIVPEVRKAPAVLATLSEPVSTKCPATILRQTSYSFLYLDADSAQLI
jgi:glucosamine-6-phosphate deaminase